MDILSLKEIKIKYGEKYFQNLKNTVRGILLFCNNMPNKKLQNPTDIIAYRVSLKLMTSKEIDQIAYNINREGSNKH